MHFRAKKQDMKKHPNSKNHLDSSVKSMNSYASEILREINSSHFYSKKARSCSFREINPLKTSLSKR